MIEKYPVIFVRFAVYLLLQILFFKDITLFNRAVCLIYITPLLLLPLDTKPWQQMIFGFVLGFATDVFYGTGGLHAAACVLIAYLRPRVLNQIVPSGGYDMSAQPLFFVMGARWFLIYSSIMVLLHHLALFLLEAFSFSVFPQAILTALASSLFTLSVIVLFQILFHRP